MLATVMAIFAGYAFSSSSTGVTSSCASSQVTIKADEPADRQEICDGVEDALRFFGRLGLALTHPLVIEIALDLPDELGDNAVGCYEEERQVVSILTFSSFERRAVWFGVPVSRSTYRSMVAHEVAHAVASCSFQISSPTLHAHEYVAYVAMLATMNPVVRAQILAARQGTGFEDLSEINELTYLFDPMRFGIEAYRHYLREEHGDPFLLKVLAGDALTNSIHDLP